ncbi:ethylmalonyl-CoA decarboxylase isoform 4-T8 [Hipposideros larvatus]
MAGSLLKTSSMSIKTKLLHQMGVSLYNTSHGFHEEEIKKTLQQFPGGSIDLQKKDDGIGILTLNNPSKKNAFSGAMILQLLEKVTELENWTEGKGLIVHGTKNTFSSGSDLNAVKALGTPEDGMALCMFMQNILTRFMRLPLISVALIQGWALGGGAEFLTACDFRWIKCSKQKIGGLNGNKTKKTSSLLCCLKQNHFRSKDTHSLKVKGWAKIAHENRNKQKAGDAILTPGKIDFTTKAITRDKEGPSNPTSKKPKMLLQGDVFIHMFIAALFTIAKIDD